jgi:hypothetical protein
VSRNCQSIETERPVNDGDLPGTIVEYKVDENGLIDDVYTGRWKEVWYENGEISIEINYYQWTDREQTDCTIDGITYSTVYDNLPVDCELSELFGIDIDATYGDL